MGYCCSFAGMLIRSATIEELEDPNAPYTTKHIRVASDPVGFGFVIRGEGPVYVKTVDPTGPAAAVGLKVCICNINNLISIKYIV